MQVVNGICRAVSGNSILLLTGGTWWHEPLPQSQRITGKSAAAQLVPD
jgi:hypothetical protein